MKHSVLNHLGEALQHLGHHWEEHRREAAAHPDLPARKPNGFSIAIEREVGAAGTQIAHEVGNRLGWPVYDHELLEEIANEMHVRTALLESVDERQQSWLLEAIENFAGPAVRSTWEVPVSEASYVHHLVETVVALGVHGRCVIVGRGASFILPTETTLRVRLIAPLKKRIAAVAQERSLSTKDATEYVRTVDRERVDFVERHFFKDPTDMHCYDLLLNTCRLSVSTAADLIVAALNRLQACVEHPLHA